MKKLIVIVFLCLVLAACHDPKDNKTTAQEQQYIQENHCVVVKSVRYPTTEIVKEYKCDDNQKMYTSSLNVETDDSSVFYTGGNRGNSGDGDFATGYVIGSAVGHNSSPYRSSSR